jgi:hypothetical protein
VGIVRLTCVEQNQLEAGRAITQAATAFCHWFAASARRSEASSARRDGLGDHAHAHAYVAPLHEKTDITSLR